MFELQLCLIVNINLIGWYLLSMNVISVKIKFKLFNRIVEDRI